MSEDFLKKLKSALDEGKPDDSLNIINELAKKSEKIEEKVKNGDITYDKIEEKIRGTLDEITLDEAASLINIDDFDINESDDDKIKKQLDSEVSFKLFADLSNMLWEYNEIKNEYVRNISDLVDRINKRNKDAFLIEELNKLNEKYNYIELVKKSNQIK